MIELTPDNALEYLRSAGRIGPGAASVTALGWGVSNVVLRVDTLPGSGNHPPRAVNDQAQTLQNHAVRINALKLIAFGRQGKLAYVLLENLHAGDDTLAAFAFVATMPNSQAGSSAASVRAA